MYKKSAIKESASAQCEAIKKDVELLQEIVDRKRGDTGTPFECPPDHHTYNWRENDWTKRLVPGIRKILPEEIEVTYTAESGLTWNRDVLKCLNIGFATTGCFLFRGAPDIIIKAKTNSLVVTGRHDEDIYTTRRQQ